MSLGVCLYSNYSSYLTELINKLFIKHYMLFLEVLSTQWGTAAHMKGAGF